MIVVVAHIISVHPRFSVYANGCGKIGVWLFFVMSAFLLVYHAKRERITLKGLGIYYWDKIIKLYPVYIIGLVAAYFLQLLPGKIDIIKHLFLMEGIGHFWYMTVIIKFYLIAPFIEWIYTKCQMKRNFVLIACTAAIIIEGCFPFTRYVENSIELRWYLPLFLIAMVVYVIYDKTRAWGKKGLWDCVVLLCLFIMVLCTPLLRWKIWGISPGNFLQNKYLLIGGLWCVIILAVSWGKYVCILLEKCRILQFIGKISYPVYIIHYIVLLKANQMAISWGINAVITVCLSIIFGVVIHWGLEKKLRKLVI